MISNRNFLITAAFLGLGLGNNLQAQEAKKLPLEEAIQLGISNSKALKRTQLSRESSAAALEGAKLQRLPNLSLSAQYTRLNSPDVSGNLLKMFSSEDNGSTEPPKENLAINANQIALGMASANVPLYAGGRINNGIKAATLLEKAAQLDVDHQKESVIENTIEAYYNLYKAQKFVDLVKENDNTAKERVKDFSNLEKNGVIPRNDLLSVQLRQKNMELAVLDAENNKKVANYNFDIMLGLDEQTDLNLSAPLIARAGTVSLNDFLNSALSNRNDVQAMDSRVQASAYNTKITKGGFLPTIALTGTYVSLDVHNLLTVTNAVNAGIGIKYNLSDLYKNGYKVKESKAQEQAAVLGYNELKDGIKIQIHKAYQDFFESEKKVEVLAEAVTLADENYKILKNKYDNGLATATELLDADAGKLQANINFEFAKIDSTIAYNRLLLSAGQLSQNYSLNK